MPTYTPFKTINPYGDIATAFAGGLADIGTHLASGYTYEDFATDASIYVETAVGIINHTNEIKSIIAYAANDYNNNHLDGYTPEQQFFIGNILSGIFGASADPDSIKFFLGDIEDNISKCGLTVIEQMPLLATTAIGNAAVDYWTTVIATPASPWITNGYLTGNIALDRANMPYWVVAAMHGALTGANKARVPAGLFDVSQQSVGPNDVAILTGSLGAGGGKVLFKWVPRMTNVNFILGLEKKVFRGRDNIKYPFTPFLLRPYQCSYNGNLVASGYVSQEDWDNDVFNIEGTPGLSCQLVDIA